MVHHKKSKFDRFTVFKSVLTKKNIVQPCLSEDLVCIPTEKKHVYTLQKHTFTFTFSARKGCSLNCDAFVAFVP